MLRVIMILSVLVGVCSCNVMPGMQNLNTSTMQVENTADYIAVNPILVPITPRLISDVRISQYFYYVAPADVLNISVWQHPEFEGVTTHSLTPTVTTSTQGAAGQLGYLVNPDGKIYFPLIGYVRVGGKTVDEIRKEISSRLKRFIKNPQINVRVVDFRSQKVYVVGEVLKPGFLPLNDQPLSIVDALSLAGSIDPNAADPSHIYVIRGNFTRPTIYWLNAKTADGLLLAEHFNLKPGDVLYISSSAVTRWNRVISQILPTVQTLWYTKSIMNK